MTSASKPPQGYDRAENWANILYTIISLNSKIWPPIGPHIAYMEANEAEEKIFGYE